MILMRATAIVHGTRPYAPRRGVTAHVVAGRNVFNWASDILDGLESLWTKPLLYAVRGWEETSV